MRPPASPSRRRFLKTATAAAGAPFILPSGSYSKPLNSRLQVAMVGADGMAYSDMKQIGSHEKAKFVGFCDIDRDRFTKADKDFPGVTHFADYVEMYDKLGDTLDAVCVAIPDHSHARASIEAMKRGKHVYCQKPLAHTVWECRQMRLWAGKTGVITQMGNQIHSNIEYRLAVRLLRDGAIGKIKEVHSFLEADGRCRQTYRDRPPHEKESAPPANVNWNLWLGPSAERPFVEGAYHPFVWRDWQTFGSGALGDFGCHIFDPIFSALDLNAPLTVRAEHKGTNHEIWPGPEKVLYVYPGNKWTAGKTLDITWYDGLWRNAPGKLEPGRTIEPQEVWFEKDLQKLKDLSQMPDELKIPRSGSIIVGESGSMVLPHVAGPRLYPLEKFQAYPYPKDVKGLEHRHVWIDHVFENQKTSDGFHYAGPLAEAVQLGNIAARHPGVTLEWDAKAMKIGNHAEAEKMLTKVYR
ncbi:MAG TPA: Gfo/Idh/MocA family oxidoreductase, partial [Verrucomicrobiaceae bacterium]